MLKLTKDEAKVWLRSVVSKHLSSRTNTYKFCIYNNGPTISSGLGLQMDLSPQEGKVIEVGEEWIAIKKGRAADFFVCERTLLETVPEVGSTVLITPYARRGFDGNRLDAPVKEASEGGYVITRFTIGESRSKLPIDKESLQSTYLKKMIEQVEELKAPDGIRRLGQVLVDAGAFQAPVTFKDPADSEAFDIPPTLRFRINTAKHVGYLDIELDVGLDYYRVKLVEDLSLNPLQEFGEVDVFTLPELIVDLVDDGQWQLAKVNVIKPAPKAKKAA